MAWWDKKAAELQRLVRNDEERMGMDYDDSAIRRAVVHGREDIVLLVSHLSAINKQLRTIRLLLWIVAIAALSYLVSSHN